MKLILDTETGELKYGKRAFNELDENKKSQVETAMRKFIVDNTKLSDYEEDCMWMSYRYCVGRHTIASHMHASDIWKNCRGRMSDERSLFTAFDINREIENCLNFRKPYFHFPLTNSRIYTTAVDIICEFMEDCNITSVEEFLKYRDVHIILTDNERGYKFETLTWEEWLRPKVLEIVSKYYSNDATSEDFAWKYFETWKSGKEMNQEEMIKAFENLTKDMPNPKNYYFSDFEDLFVWNDLVHCFDFEHHHESILTDGTRCKWFWTWTNNTEKRDDGYYYRAFGYKRIRVPVDRWNGAYSSYLPDESIKEDLY